MMNPLFRPPSSLSAFKSRESAKSGSSTQGMTLGTVPQSTSQNAVDSQLNGHLFFRDSTTGTMELKGEYRKFIDFVKYSGDTTTHKESSIKYVEMLLPGEHHYQGGIYSGEWDEDSNSPRGQGTLKIKNGENTSTYKGTWENGTVTFSNGTTHTGPDWKGWKIPGYTGDMENGKRHGMGSFTYINNVIYEGLWENDKRNGKGTLIYLDGGKCESIEGIWRNDIMDRNAIYRYKNGDINKCIEWGNHSGIEYVTRILYKQSTQEVFSQFFLNGKLEKSYEIPKEQWQYDRSTLTLTIKGVRHAL